jgi:hypothetical protein
MRSETKRWVRLAYQPVATIPNVFSFRCPGCDRPLSFIAVESEAFCPCGQEFKLTPFTIATRPEKEEGE